MFGFANGLLAFLALAAVLDFLPVLRHRRAPAVWWGEERLLFTTRYASVRQKYGAWAFLLGVMVYEFIVVFNNSMARENWPWLQTRVSPVLDWVMYLCFGFKILLGTKYNGRSMVCAGLLYFVARWVYFNGQNIWWLGLCVALLAAKDVPLRRVMKAFLACGVPTLALVELLHFAGIIAPDAASERNGSYRLMFGYGHPNTFGGVMFGLLLAWVLLRRARLTWPELAGVAAVGVFLMVGPKSRSAALCTFLLVLLLALAKLRTRRGLHPGSRPLAALCAATVPVLGARQLFEAVEQLGGVLAAVGFHDADQPLAPGFPLLPECLQHGKGLANAGGRAEENFQPATALAGHLGQQRIGPGNVIGSAARHLENLCQQANGAGNAVDLVPVQHNRRQADPLKLGRCRFADHKAQVRAQGQQAAASGAFLWAVQDGPD